MTTDNKQVVFLLYEHLDGTINGRNSTLLDIYSDWKQCEDARVGLEAWKEHAWFSYSVEEWQIKYMEKK